MSLVEIILVGLGLAMDVFAISICKGMAMKKISWKKAITLTACFGIFHSVMLTLGYFLGSSFKDFIENVDHWVAFILLIIIGLNMIKESFKNEGIKENEKSDIKSILILAIATSIDALAVGITFAFFEVNIVWSAIIIGLIPFAVSTVGIKIGNVFGNKLQNKAKVLGGLILIIIGLKILLEHLGIWG